MNDKHLRDQINSLIRDEIQEVINDYVDEKESEEESSKQSGLGFFDKEEDVKELKVNISEDQVDKILKEYKKIKKNEKSNLSQIKKLGLVDKHGRPLN